MPISRDAIKTMSRLRDSLTTHFVDVLGNLEPIGQQTVLRYDGQLDI